MDRNPPRRQGRLGHRAQAARGSVKKFLGRATDDRRLESRGRRDQFRGNIKLAANKVRDAFKH